MDELKSTTTTTVDELINVLLDTIISLKDLLRKLDFACFVPQYTRPTMQEIYDRRQASLEHYRQQYVLEHGDDDDDFEGGEDEIDGGSKKLENSHEHQERRQQEPYEWYYTARSL